MWIFNAEAQRKIQDKLVGSNRVKTRFIELEDIHLSGLLRTFGLTYSQFSDLKITNQTEMFLEARQLFPLRIMEVKEKGQTKYKCKCVNVQQCDGAKEHACSVNLPWFKKKKETEREQPTEMSLNQHTAARSLANERQPVSAH